jgi:hypothetical protein
LKIVEKMSNLEVVVFFIVLALCCICQPLICNAYQIHIENQFQRALLGARCKSKDNDLGLHLIPAHSEFSWVFSGNFFRTTLFYCNLMWEGGHQSFVVFKYDDGFLKKYCPHPNSECRWRTHEDGIYAYNFGAQNYDLMYKWQPNQN